jgi:hypothetical protein
MSSRRGLALALGMAMLGANPDLRGQSAAALRRVGVLGVAQMRAST